METSSAGWSDRERGGRRHGSPSAPAPCPRPPARVCPCGLVRAAAHAASRPPARLNRARRRPRLAGSSSDCTGRPRVGRTTRSRPREREPLGGIPHRPLTPPPVQKPWIPRCRAARSWGPRAAHLWESRPPALWDSAARTPTAPRCTAVKGLWSLQASAANCPRQLPSSSSSTWPPGDPETRSNKLHF